MPCVPLDRSYLKPLETPLWESEYASLNPGTTRRPNPVWLSFDRRGWVHEEVIKEIKHFHRDWIRKRRRWMHEKRNGR